MLVLIAIASASVLGVSFGETPSSSALAARFALASRCKAPETRRKVPVHWSLFRASVAVGTNPGPR